MIETFGHRGVGVSRPRQSEPGKRYSEKQVNETLSRYHEDTASLWRELVGAKLMEREGGGGEYWRTDK